MAIQNYDTESARIGKLKGQILKHAIPVEVLGITGDNFKIGKNQSDTIVFRRWLPTGGATTDATTINQWNITANAHLTTEGVTPDADTILPQDITVQLNQYSALYTYTDKTADLYEDDVPKAMKQECGERMGLVRELIRYGTLKGCTNLFYAGGTSRTTVDEAISLPILRKVTRSIIGNRGKMVTTILEASIKYNTAPVSAAMLVFAHSDCENDIRELPGFKEVSEYANRKPVHPMELGSVDRYRFIISPELVPIDDSGAAVGQTDLVSTTGTSIDVYPYIVIAQDAWADVALRGKDSFDVTHIPAGKKEKVDPHGQRGYVGAIFWSACFIQNDGWMAVVECGVAVLS